MNELKIRQERIKRGWTQKYVGQQVGIGKVAVHGCQMYQSRCCPAQLATSQ